MPPGALPYKIVTVVGARPQFIKAAALSRAMRTQPGLEEVLVHTGQHHDPEMSDVFFAELEIAKPKRFLGVHGGGHGEMTGRMLGALEKALVEERPEMVLVYGDTNSTLAGALAAAKLHIPVAHVEAGLRSFNRRMPEEINRVVADHLSTLQFCPTEESVKNLEHEGITAGVHRVGDVMYDCALFARARALESSRILEKLGLEEGGFALATVHRAENTDDAARLQAIVGALRALAREIDVVWPLHPRTRKVLAALGVELDGVPSLHVTGPLGYLDMIELQAAAALVVTDSGGVQKEAFFFGRPCVTLRDETEWVELVDAGWNRLAPPTSVDALTAAMRAALGSRGAPVRPYGDGDAAQRIAAILEGGAA